MHIILFLVVVVGCSDKAADDTALTADETATEVTAGWGDVSAAANPSLVLEEVFTVTLDEPAAIAIRCTRVDRPEEVHLVESAAPPSSIPSAVGVAKGEPGAAYTLMPHQRLMLDEGSFQVHQVDVTTDTLVWSWKVEDHPDVIPSYSDANRAGIMTAGDGSQTMVISRCEQFEVIGVDMATGELAWSLGEEGTLELTAGSRPRCQHGLGVHGDRLLLYDNGARPTSRAVEYALDVEAGTIAETWSWTEDGWSELGWGDVDYLGDDRVVITRGHASGWGDEGASQIIELDRTDDSEIWRLAFDDDSVYALIASTAASCSPTPPAARRWRSGWRSWRPGSDGARVSPAAHGVTV